MVPDPIERIDATKKTNAIRRIGKKQPNNKSNAYIVPVGFRYDNSSKNLEQKFVSLQSGRELDVFIHPEIGMGFLGQGDYSDAVTGVLDKAYCLGIAIAGGKARKISIDSVAEFLKELSSDSFLNPLYITAKAVQFYRKKDDALFEKSPIKVSLYRRNNLRVQLGRYIDYDSRHRMVAEVKYIPLGLINPDNAKTIRATEIGKIKVYREN